MALWQVEKRGTWKTTFVWGCCDRYTNGWSKVKSQFGLVVFRTTRESRQKCPGVNYICNYRAFMYSLESSG